MLKKKIWVSFQRIEPFTQELLENRGLGSGIRKNTYSGVKKATDPGSGSATLDGGTLSLFVR
jgi:hypothetical protein